MELLAWLDIYHFANEVSSCAIHHLTLDLLVYFHYYYKTALDPERLSFSNLSLHLPEVLSVWFSCPPFSMQRLPDLALVPTTGFVPSIPIPYSQGLTFFVLGEPKAGRKSGCSLSLKPICHRRFVFLPLPLPSYSPDSELSALFSLLSCIRLYHFPSVPGTAVYPPSPPPLRLLFSGW